MLIRPEPQGRDQDGDLRTFVPRPLTRISSRRESTEALSDHPEIPAFQAEHLWRKGFSVVLIERCANPAAMLPAGPVAL